MSGSQVKPWGQQDDNGTGVAMLETDGADASVATDESVMNLQSSRIGGLTGARWSIVLLAAFFPLLLAAIWLGYIVVATWGANGNNVIGAGQAIGIFLLIIATGALLVMARIGRQAALVRFRTALGGRNAAGEQVLIDSEFRPLWEAVEQHADNAQHRLNELLEQHKQLSLELSLAGTQKRHTEAIINAISSPIIVTDSFDRLLLANSATEELFQFKIADAMRRPVGDVISDERIATTIRKTREADARAARRNFLLELGECVHDVTVAPVDSGDGAGDPASERHGVVLVMRDITREHESSNKKSDFVAKVAHELRTPLASILAYVEMLVDDEAQDDQTRREYYSIIESSAARLGRLIDNMLNISRIEAGTIRISRDPVGLSIIVKEAIDMARPQAEEKKIQLTDELTPVVYRVNADRDLLYQAVLNLLSNAIKYTPDGGKVHVKMTPREDSNTVQIDVIDNGVGIPAEDLPRMFEKFFRVESSKNMAKGTGLGLNLVKHIVESVHEGKMNLTSEVGKGSTFGMTLPLVS